MQPPEVQGCQHLQSQVQCRISHNGSFAVHNPPDPTRWHADYHRKVVLRDFKPLDTALHEHLTRVDRRLQILGHHPYLVIVPDLHIFSTSGTADLLNRDDQTMDLQRAGVLTVSS